MAHHQTKTKIERMGMERIETRTHRKINNFIKWYDMVSNTNMNILPIELVYSVYCSASLCLFFLIASDKQYKNIAFWVKQNAEQIVPLDKAKAFDPKFALYQSVHIY